MRRSIILILFFLSAGYAHAQQIIVKLNITECVNCTSTLERINNDTLFSTFQKFVVLPSEYFEDSIYIRNNFGNLESYKLIFDDVQYKKLNTSSLSEIRFVDKQGNVLLQKSLYELANTNLNESLSGTAILDTKNISYNITNNDRHLLSSSAELVLPFQYKSSMEMAYYDNTLFFLDKLKNKLTRFYLNSRVVDTLDISIDSLAKIFKLKNSSTQETILKDIPYTLLSVTAGDGVFLNIRVLNLDPSAPPVEVILDLVSGKYTYTDYVYDMANPYIFPVNYLLAKQDSLYVVKHPIGDDKHSKNTLSLFLLKDGRYVEQFELPSVYEGVYKKIWGDLYSVAGTFPYFTLPLSNKLYRIENRIIKQIALPDSINIWPNQLNTREDIFKSPKLGSVISQTRYNKAKGEVYMLYSFFKNEVHHHQLICYHIKHDKFTVKSLSTFPENISHKLLIDDGSILYVDKSKNTLVIVPF